MKFSKLFLNDNHMLTYAKRAQQIGTRPPPVVWILLTTDDAIALAKYEQPDMTSKQALAVFIEKNDVRVQTNSLGGEYITDIPGPALNPMDRIRRMLGMEVKS